MVDIALVVDEFVHGVDRHPAQVAVRGLRPVVDDGPGPAVVVKKIEHVGEQPSSLDELSGDVGDML